MENAKAKAEKELAEARAVVQKNKEKEEALEAKRLEAEKI